jgi:hypothetical protein
LSFEGETHQEIVAAVRTWLASVDQPDPIEHLSAEEAVTQGAELTKEALRIIAAAAPEPVAHSEVVRSLAEMGYKATDATRAAIVDGLDTIADLTGGSVLRRKGGGGRRPAYEMSADIARQLLGGRPRKATPPKKRT